MESCFFFFSYLSVALAEYLRTKIKIAETNVFKRFPLQTYYSAIHKWTFTHVFDLSSMCGFSLCCAYDLLDYSDVECKLVHIYTFLSYALCEPTFKYPHTRQNVADTCEQIECLDVRLHVICQHMQHYFY